MSTTSPEPRVRDYALEARQALDELARLSEEERAAVVQFVHDHHAREEERRERLRADLVAVHGEAGVVAMEAEASRRSAHADLISDGVDALTRGVESAKRWEKRVLGKVQTLEGRAALLEILRRAERRMYPADQMPRPRKLPAFWLRRVRDPVAFLSRLVRKRVGSRRFDRKRQAAVRRRVSLDDAVDDLRHQDLTDTQLVVLTEIAEDRDREAPDMEALLQVAESRGLRLSPKRRELLKLRADRQSYAQIVTLTGGTEEAARVTHHRAMKQLEAFARAAGV